jgi:SNF2 family DNA or RNA helicase
VTLELRPYQEEAVERILDRSSLLLALTMGAGKTATSIAAIRKLRRERAVSHGVVFALKSTKWQWVREIHKWDPRARVQVVDGDKAERTRAIKRAQHYEYTILHYQCLIHDWDVITTHLPIDFVVLDEVTTIKNFSAKTTKRAKILGKHTEVRLGLSGQPVEGVPEHLYSIMEFIDPDVLGGFHKFDRTFIERDHWGKPVRYKNLHLIKDRLGPAMYRKSREDISEWLPDMIELPMPVELEPEHMALHDLVKDELSAAIDKALAAGARGGSFDIQAHYGRTPGGHDAGLMGAVMSRMLAMRMLSSHPALLKVSADNFDSPVSRSGSQYASELRAAGVLDSLPPTHAKLDSLLEMVREIVDEDPRHKVVIFSFFKPMLSILGIELRKLGITHSTITGDVSGLERDKRIQSFNTNPDHRVFLSSDAGAYGISLGAGSHLICYDLPWSSGALAQRISRIDRTDSLFDQIMIGYMFGQDTIEERMFNMLQQKRKIARAFIDGEFDYKSGTLTLDLQSLREFLDA